VSRSLVLASFLLLSLACVPAGLAEDSAPELGCKPEDITVDEMHVPLEGPSSWRATCGGQRWFCSRADKRVICTEDPR